MFHLIQQIENIIKSFFIKIKAYIEAFPHFLILFFILLIFSLSAYFDSLAKAFAAVGTIAAVIWALYHQEIKRYRERPILEIKEFKMDFPYFREATERNRTTGEDEAISYYINIPLENIGKRIAKNCTPILTGIGKIEGTIWNKEGNWIPVPLKWAADERELTDKEYGYREINYKELNYMESINKIPKVERDLIPYRPYFFNLGRLSFLHPSSFKLLTVMELTAQKHDLGTGHYCLEVKIVAEEINPIIKYFHINWNGSLCLVYKAVKESIDCWIEDRSPWDSTD
jgi:hypothetical protein